MNLISEIIALAWVKEGRTWDKYGSTYVPLMQGKISEYVSAVARVCEAGPSRSSSHLSVVPDDDSEAAGSVRVGRAVVREMKKLWARLGKSIHFALVQWRG